MLVASLHNQDDLVEPAFEICRDDRCEIEEVHPVHSRARSGGLGFSSIAFAFANERPVGLTRRRKRIARAQAMRGEAVSNLVVEAVFEHTSPRLCKTASQIYRDVIDDVGAMDLRQVQRGLRVLIGDRRLFLIVPRGAHDAIARLGPSYSAGAYIRGDSPLLFERGGFDHLQDQLSDLLSVD